MGKLLLSVVVLMLALGVFASQKLAIVEDHHYLGNARFDSTYVVYKDDTNFSVELKFLDSLHDLCVRQNSIPKDPFGAGMCLVMARSMLYRLPHMRIKFELAN